MKRRKENKPGPCQLAAEAEWAKGGAEPWRNLGIAEVPDPIRLNRDYLLQWDPIFEESNSNTGDPLRRHHVVAVDPPIERVLDWTGFADQIGLSREQKSVFFAHWADGVPMSHVHTRLGIKRHAAAKLYVAVKRKLGMQTTKEIITDFVILVSSGSSLVGSFRQRQSSGGREGPWALSKPPKDLLNITLASLPFSNRLLSRESVNTFLFWKNQVSGSAE